MIRVLVLSLADGRTLHDVTFPGEREAKAYMTFWQGNPTVFTEWYRA